MQAHSRSRPQPDVESWVSGHFPGLHSDAGFRPLFQSALPSIAIPLRWAGNDVGRDRDYNASTTRALPAAGTAQQTSAVPSTRLAEGAVG